ncbi:MAG TPA: two-component regulator propeller domain-containing protein [Alphaproteobacteria bacterium]|nr:two-component regulator propeller domain-containing protein [Alphaproteobacteria bacterium]
MIRKFYIALYFCWAGLAFFGPGAQGADSDLNESAIWRVADGLPSDSVTAIIQTRDSFMWIGTDAGLVRFDGVKFSQLPLAAVTTNTVFHITALCEDSNGNLWIGTQQNGLFEKTRGNIRHFMGVLLDASVTSLAADDHGRVWVGTRSGLNFWNGDQFQAFTVRDGLPDEMVAGVNVARSGTVWITTRAGMCRFINGRIAPYGFQTQSQGRSPEHLGVYEDRRGNLWAYGDTYLINLAEGKRFNYFRSSESELGRIWSLCEGQDGRLWIGTSGRGLFCFEDNHFEPVLFDKERPYDVRAICEDNQGNLWMGTSGAGLIQLRPQLAYILHEEQGLPDSPATTLATDAAGQVYIGLQRGGLFVGQSGRFDAVDSSGNLAVENYVSSVCVARDGAVWAGTLGAGLYGLRNGREIHLTTADGLADDNVTVVCGAANGDVWFGTGNGGAYRLTDNGLDHFDSAAGFPIAPVTAMTPAASGGLWLGTQDGQIIRENDGRLAPVPGTGALAHSSILALYEGQSGRVWIGTAGEGLRCITEGKVASWTTMNGLPSDVIAGIVEDAKRNLWLATGAGIYRVNRGDADKSLANDSIPLVCQLVKNEKTIPDPSTISGGVRAVCSPDGLLWFATSEGVLSVDTRNPEVTHYAFPIYVVSVAFNKQPPVPLLETGATVSPADPFTAPVDLNSLEFQFTALDYSAPGDIQFRHKLEGDDADWVDDGNTRSAHYGRLGYGRYTFHVEARNPNGKWQPASNTFTFIVPAPLYFQTWALCFYGLAAIALVSGTVRMVSHRRLRVRLARLEQQQSLERERMRIARDMHDEMGSKLTKISFLSERAAVDAKSGQPLAEKIDSIAQTSRDLLKTMDEIVWVVNPRNDTLENLASYLAHYAFEYFQNTAVECDVRLPREVPNYPLSSEARHNLFLAFEEALNNVLKHSAATKVKVEMNAGAKEFELKVIDNGKGFETVAPPAMKEQARGGRDGNGLRNMRQRMTSMGGECLVLSQDAHGTAVIMRIPLYPRTTDNS